MPTPHCDRIRLFMQRAGQDTPSMPAIPDEATRELRARLILEEALETVHALGVEVTLASDQTQAIELESLALAAGGTPDLEGIVDGCADISVVTIGTLIALGVDDEMVLEEVDRANLRKFGPGSYRREDGKWMKPPGWSPPDIPGVLQRQGA